PESMRGYVLSLDGDGDFVETTLKDLSGPELTIQYWFKGSNIQSAVRQQSAGFIVAGWNNLHILSHDGSTAGIAAGNTTDGAWHHVAMTWKQGTAGGLTSYLDGEVVESRDSVDEPIPNHDANVFLGAFNGAGEFANGMLDDVSIWNRALTAEEIKAAMDAPLVGDENGLSAYWNFDDGTAKDASGSGYDGTLGGDAVIIDSDIGAPGKIMVEIAQVIQGNQVLCLDGEGDTVEVGTIDDLSGSEITIQYWFKGSSIQSAVRQQAAGYIVAGWGNQHILSNDGGTAGIPTGNAIDGTWHSVIMTWKQDTVGGFASYLDGELIASRDSSNSTIPFNGSPLYFGSFNGASEFMNGCIDEISIWNKARTRGEIRATWNLPLRGNESGLIGYWKFDDGNATDVTAGRNDGDFLGDATTMADQLPGFGGSRQQTEIDVPGAFSILNVPEGEDYFITAYYDRNGNGIRDASEPYGEFEGNPFELIANKMDVVVNLIDPVSIVAQPTAIALQEGENASLTVEISGQGPLTYSWMKNGVALNDEAGRIAGAKTATLSLTSVTAGDSGGYSLTVSNEAGSVTSAVISLSVAPDDIASGLVGHWKFDEISGETLADSSDSGTAGALVDFDDTDGNYWVAGQIGGALDFESDNGSYVIVDNYEMPTAAITVSAWVNAESLSTWGSILKNWGGGVTGQFHFGLNAGDGDISNFLTTDDGSLPFARTNTAFATGVWHHVAFTADGASLAIYQDGAEAARVAYSGALIESEIPGLGIGVKTDDSGAFPDGGNPGFWDGMIDDLGLWARALTPAEITAVYEAGLRGESLDKASLTSNETADPGLTIEAIGDAVVLSWSASEAGWVLKSTTDLPAGEWQNVPGDVVSEGGRNKVSITPATAVQWFRLELP
ncbi:MAG: immunoglobulin domain-containing protein, partial [Verrucomicrobiae bacterium]|nr:immunoglobulin domain-containing protein [Verrucomicrobiae bacterium]